MIEPLAFGDNPETALDNSFQRPVPPDEADRVASRAREEFRSLREALEERGIEVVVPSLASAPSPDMVFPNNWFSTHPEGKWFLYPMRAASRRRERRPEIVAWLRGRYGEPVDLTEQETAGRFLEGTGSLVIDEPRRVVYASRSSRTDEELVRAWASESGYRSIVFGARDGAGREVYHTNVVLALGTGYAILCAGAITAPDERKAVLVELERSGRDVIEITLEQLHAFCANALELENAEGRRFLVLSERAWSALTPAQREQIGMHVEPVRVALDTIETHGGGGARCMLAELW